MLVRTDTFERLTVDHKVGSPSERQRIEKLGGKIEDDRIVLKK